RQRDIPPKILAVRLDPPPDFTPCLGRACDDDTASQRDTSRVGSRDDQIRQVIAGYVGHGHDPVTEEAVGPFTIPGADAGAGDAGPHRGGAVLQPLWTGLEARTRSDVRVSVAVNIERLAESKSELAGTVGPSDAPGDTPTCPGRRA